MKKKDKSIGGEFFDLEVEKEGYVIFNKITGELEKMHFDKYLDMVSERDEDGVMVVKTWVDFRDLGR